MNKIEKELTLISTQFNLTNYGNFYFKDADGKIYHWYTASDKAYEEMEVDGKYLCKFVENGSKFNSKYGTAYAISNVRFKTV